MVGISKKEDKHYFRKSLPIPGLILLITFFIMTYYGQYSTLESFAPAILLFLISLILIIKIKSNIAKKIYIADMIDYEFSDNNYESSLQATLDKKSIEYEEPIKGFMLPKIGCTYLKEMFFPVVQTLRWNIPYLYIDKNGIVTFLYNNLRGVVFSMAHKTKKYSIKTLGRTEEIFNFEKIEIKKNKAYTNSKHLLIRHLVNKINEEINPSMFQDQKITTTFDDEFCKCEIILNNKTIPEDIIVSMQALIELNKIFISEELIVVMPHTKAD